MALKSQTKPERYVERATRKRTDGSLILVQLFCQNERIPSLTDSWQGRLNSVNKLLTVNMKGNSSMPDEPYSEIVKKRWHRAQFQCLPMTPDAQCRAVLFPGERPLHRLVLLIAFPKEVRVHMCSAHCVAIKVRKNTKCIKTVPIQAFAKC